MSRRTLAAAVVVAACTACGSAGQAPERPAPAEPVETSAAETSAATAPAGPSVVEPVEILRAWDAARARAWALGDLDLLRSLYTPGSVAGREDIAMLRAWSARGLVVRDLRTQLISVRELGHRSSAWTLLVTDRLAGGVAVGAGLHRPLPRDQATTRTVRLRRVAGRWRVSAVELLRAGS
ncbi:MAG TPA: hypothetical protein VFV89_09580 [Nocardioides sp.]|uniref:hypothetical protein n=1 Tax=Nocardioides sp. TaxID=35761 RepID=UPI002E36DA3C|nr:hypothetical protein [Nocardioides sp.]HEX5088048.1 hypothetical protein [Nocardioides sp.]